MSPQSQPTKNTKRKLPPTFGSASDSSSISPLTFGNARNSYSRPKTGAAYFEAAKKLFSDGDTEVEDSDTPIVKRTSIRTRGHKAHPGREQYSVRRATDAIGFGAAQVSEQLPYDGDTEIGDAPQSDIPVVGRTRARTRGHSEHPRRSYGMRSDTGGSSFFKAAQVNERLINKNTQLLDSDISQHLDERTRAETRGHRAHLGYKTYGIKHPAGATYSETARADGQLDDGQLANEQIIIDDTEVEDAAQSDVPQPVKRFRGRYRGQKQVPGRKVSSMKCGRKMRTRVKQLSPSDIEDSITVASRNQWPALVSVESPLTMESPVTATPEEAIIIKKPLIFKEPASSTSKDFVYPQPETRVFKSYSNVIPEDNSEPITVSREDLDELERQEEALEDMRLQQAQWKMKMDELDMRILNGINKLGAHSVAAMPKVNTRSTRGRGRGCILDNSIDALGFGDMNASIAMMLAKGVLYRGTDLGLDEFEAGF